MSAAVWALTGDLFLEDDLLMAEEATELALDTEQLCRLPLATAEATAPDDCFFVQVWSLTQI